MLPLGQEQANRSFVELYRQLPAKPFQTVKPRSQHAQAQPLVVRTLRQTNQTFVYVVNDSPWSCSAEIRIITPSDCILSPLGEQIAPTVRRES